jgi:outer membrane receptor protein involved in Fe transport
VTLAVLASLTQPAFSQSSDPAPVELPQVVVIGTTPLPGIGLSKEQIPAAVQSATARDLAGSKATDLADFLNRSMGSVHVNETQGNPFMVDVNYRGYTASPLLGTPQGLSVYLDGVRMNQPFGDVVMWDLIPQSAISSVTLMAGGNPLFGLNTLGGSLAIETKDGRRNPGTALELTAGSYGRASLGLEHGGSNEQGLDWFVTGKAYRESGWRDDSPSRIGQLFGKLGWHDASTDIKLSLSHADNDLTGNGLQEAQMLEADRSSVFTKPDQTRNRATMLNLRGKTSLSDQLMLSGNAYWRHTRTTTLNGDLNEGALGQDVYYSGQTADQTWLAANGHASAAAEGAGTLPTLRCIAQAGLGGAPNDYCTGLINTSSTRQSNAGLSAQLSFSNEAPGLRNLAVVGAAYDSSLVHFKQGTEFGYLNADRSITGVGVYADGTQDSENAFDQRVDLSGKVRTWSVFGTNTLSLDETWHLTTSARYNDTRLTNTDRLYPYNNATTQGEQRGSLDGNHTFRRLNPSLGVSFTPSRAFGSYLGYSESSRAPTSIELGCADPEFGCRLPNSMAGDPALKQVVSRTWELGVRGALAHKTSWNLGYFRGDSSDDILFVANSASTGYFKNVGKTRREGIEAGLSGTLNKLSLGLNYTYLIATYQSQEALNSQYNSAADANGAITVKAGDHIPLIPSHLLKANAHYQLSTAVGTALEMVAVGGSFVRGNENNLHTADGDSALGSGRVPGYAVFNLSFDYQIDKQFKLFGSINNLFDRQYETAGQLGPYAFTATGAYRNSDATGTTFYSPGAPRMFWLGLRYTL